MDGISPLIIIVAALALYVLFAVLRRKTDGEEVKREKLYEKNMRNAAERESDEGSGRL